MDNSKSELTLIENTQNRFSGSIPNLSECSRFSFDLEKEDVYREKLLMDNIGLEMGEFTNLHQVIWVVFLTSNIRKV